MPEHVLMTEIEIIADGGRRRRWTAAEKLRIVEETLDDRASISIVARRNGVAQEHGHEVRPVPAAYLKPFVKRQTNDRADAEVIAEHAMRPAMRFVAVKSAETQVRTVAFRTHQCLVRQCTQIINALRGHLAEFGLVAPKGPASLKILENALEDQTSDLPGPGYGTIYVEQIARLTEVIDRLAAKLKKRHRRRMKSCGGFAPFPGSAPSPPPPSRRSPGPRYVRQRAQPLANSPQVPEILRCDVDMPGPLTNESIPVDAVVPLREPLTAADVRNRYKL